MRPPDSLKTLAALGALGMAYEPLPSKKMSNHAPRLNAKSAKSKARRMKKKSRRKNR